MVYQIYRFLYLSPFFYRKTTPEEYYPHLDINTLSSHLNQRTVGTIKVISNLSPQSSRISLTIKCQLCGIRRGQLRRT